MLHVWRQRGGRAVTGSGLRIWVALTLAPLREAPGRLLATVAAVALGVALGCAVYWINRAALAQFDSATRRLVGQADLIVRGPATGFNQDEFVHLARDPAVRTASPVLDLEVALAGHRLPLHVLGIDPFLAASIQPQLMGALAGDVLKLFHPGSIVLSRAAAEALHLQRGDRLEVLVGTRPRTLRVIDVLPSGLYSEPLGLMDIASAQWTLGRLGKLDRIDLRLRPGVNVAGYRARLAAELPAGLVVHTPGIERSAASRATLAYRVNLNMLALVALLTGAFLVFSTQSLSVLRRRVSFALLRALGLTRGQLQRLLLAEGIAIGAIGSLLGVLLGTIAAAVMLHRLGADLGNRELATLGALFRPGPEPMLVFFVIGTIVTAMGAWLPAREAAQRPPALALRAGDVEPALQGLSASGPGLALVGLGAVLAVVPPVHGLPLAGYASIAALLLGSVLLVPALVRRLAGRLPQTRRVTLDAAVAQLQGNAGLSAVSLAAMIVSFSLMVAMAIMVHSFRNSFDLWLIRLLPADLQLRLPPDSQTASLSAAEQQRIAALPGVARVEYLRTRSIYLSAQRPPVTLLARELTRATAARRLPLLSAAVPTGPAGLPPAWISEALRDLYGYRLGARIDLPLGGRQRPFRVAGVWRDYVHDAGAVVIRRADYIADTADATADQAAIWRRPGVSLTRLERSVRAVLPDGAAVQVLTTTRLRQRSLAIFDRAFAVTYVLEGAAVLIGLLGVSVAASSNALARRAQFGMLRHLGMLKREVLTMLASEGLLTSLFAVLYGLALGAVLSLVLIYVINRQSFHWSIDLAVPWPLLVALGVALVAAAAVTAVVSGRAALSVDALRAVREDW